MKRFLIVVILLVATFCFSKPKLNLDYAIYTTNRHSLPKYSNNIRLYFNDNIFIGNNIIVYNNKCINDMHLGYIVNNIENILGYDKELYYRLNAKYGNNLKIYSKNKIWFNGYYNGEYGISYEKDILNARLGVFIQKIKNLNLYPVGHIGIKLKIYENKNYNMNFNTSLEFIKKDIFVITSIDIVIQ